MPLLSISFCLTTLLSRRAFRVGLNVLWRSAKKAVASFERMFLMPSELTAPWMATPWLMVSMSHILQGLGVLKSIMTVVVSLDESACESEFRGIEGGEWC